MAERTDTPSHRSLYERETPRVDAIVQIIDGGMQYAPLDKLLPLARQLEQELDTVRDAHMANCLASDTLRTEIHDLREQLSARSEKSAPYSTVSPCFDHNVVACEVCKPEDWLCGAQHSRENAQRSAIGAPLHLLAVMRRARRYIDGDSLVATPPREEMLRQIDHQLSLYEPSASTDGKDHA